jgi:teichuronic acid biosynthesis glycosyltransferase TuaC
MGLRHRLRVLVLSRNYPNSVFPDLGLWVQRQVSALAGAADMTVVAPVPYCPPLPGPRSFTRFRQIERHRTEHPRTPVYHPRFLVGPGYSTHALEAGAYYAGIARLISRLHRTCAFDVVHAHFGYPDGVVALRLGTELGLPVVVTEHSLWRPWMERHPRVRRQATAAARGFAAHVGVSSAVLRSIEPFTGPSDRQHIIPIGVDGGMFPPGPGAGGRRPEQLLFVGRLNHVKGIDVLLHAFARLVARRPAATLVIVGGGLYRRTERRGIEQLAAGLSVTDRLVFTGPLPAVEVARLMRESAVLVSSSRRESCGAVLLESLASGLPVVATRCGGPEDIVTEEVGVLVPTEDPAALCDGIDRVLTDRNQYDPRSLRSYALSRFGWDRLSDQYLDLYRRCVGEPAHLVTAS